MTTTPNLDLSKGKAMVIVLLDGPYVSQYADIGYKLAQRAIKLGYSVKIFLYMDGVHIPRRDQDPSALPNISQKFLELIDDGCEIKACVRCAAARGYLDESQYLHGVRITSVYDLATWMDDNNKVIILGS